MLSHETRRLTAAEREELEAERAQKIVALAREAEASRLHPLRAALAVLLLVAPFAGIAAFNVYRGHLDAAAVAGAGTAWFLGMAAWIWFRDRNTSSSLDNPEVERIDETLARDQVRVIEIRADAAVTVRAGDGDGALRCVGHLLRTTPDQVVFLSRELCPELDPESLPNTHIWIAVEPWPEVRIAALGERIEPLAVVDVAFDEQIWLRLPVDMIVWTPGEQRCESLGIFDLEMYPTRVPVGLEAAAAALLARTSA